MDRSTLFGYQHLMTDFARPRQDDLSQVRPNGITDGRIIQAMAGLPREFSCRKRAAASPIWMRTSISARPLLMEPMALAKLVQLAEIDAGDHVLHVGCGTGYATAVLAALASRLWRSMRTRRFVDMAERQSRATRHGQCQNAQGAACHGLEHGQPYDAIVVDGHVPVVPQALFQQLKDGGRLVAVVGDIRSLRQPYSRNDGDDQSRRRSRHRSPGCRASLWTGPALSFD